MARFFDREGDFGVVMPGAAADLILLDSNPLDDISNMSKISGVMVRGQWLSRDEIDDRLAEMAEKNQ